MLKIDFRMPTCVRFGSIDAGDALTILHGIQIAGKFLLWCLDATHENYMNSNKEIHEILIRSRLILVFL
jgi:3-deoxy-D-arabino-heptulosonate 7-phosphate (DAHP) synthase class II